MTAPSSSTARCPAVLIAAPASGQGKTSVTAALARHHRRRGLRVRVFKTGPDFIDPMLLARACGQPVQQLDLFMGGLAHCRALLHEAAATSDLVLVEGVMGLYDGEPSSADLAVAFGLPVLCVIDASAMAQTFAAVAQGLARFRNDLRCVGVVANRVGSAAHGQMVGQVLPAWLPLVAAIAREAELALPERHLGLVQAMELSGLDAMLDRWADAWAQGGGGGGGDDDWLPPSVDFEAEPSARVPLDAGTPRLDGVRIAIAHDAAFSFIYAANLDVLRALGAELSFFSPLAGQALPPCDALWLPGGYPELHAPALAPDTAWARSLRAHHAAGRPILAECGGLLCLLDTLVAIDGTPLPMAGVLRGRARMHARFQALGLQRVALPEGVLRGHSFHCSTMHPVDEASVEASVQAPVEVIAHGSCPNGGRTAEAVWRQGRLTASYIHHYFASNPAAVARLFAPSHGVQCAPSRGVFRD